MITVRRTTLFLLLVGACFGLPQYSGQGGVDRDQDPVTSQCTSNQGCVPYFQCVDGYINTDGAGLLDLRLQPKATCTEPEYPDVPAVCCNIPGIPEILPPEEEPCPVGTACVSEKECFGEEGLLDIASGLFCGNSNIHGVCCDNPLPPSLQCASNQGCVPYFQCVDGYINTDGAGLLDLRLQPNGTCRESNYPDVPAVCCNIPGISGTPPPVEDSCPVGTECIPETDCLDNGLDTDLTVVPFDIRLSGSTCGDLSNPGVCCANPSSFQTCTGEEICVSIDNIGSYSITDESKVLKPCFVEQTSEVGFCHSSTKPITTICPVQSVCIPETLCQEPIFDDTGLDSVWSGCPIDGNEGNLGVCCLEAAPISPVYQAAEQCGVRNANIVPDTRILSNIAYNEAQFGEFPWQAIIFFSNYTFKCGASIIGERWLVTAAHCVAGYTPYDFTVRVGEWQVNTFDEPRPYLDVDLATVTIHPQFNPRNVHNDIAVLELVEPLIFRYHINSICLPSPEQTFWGQRCIATGWGKDAFDGHYQHIMKRVELPTVEHHQCQNLLRKTRLGKFFQLDDSFMCAGGEENKDACKGDGGGPLACQDPVTGQYVLTGITAFGVGCGNKDVPGVYADVQALLPFIQAVVAGSYDPNVYNQ